MASMHNKLCSCLGFALRLAKKNHVDPEVCGYLQTALFALTEGQRSERRWKGEQYALLKA